MSIDRFSNTETEDRKSDLEIIDETSNVAACMIKIRIVLGVTVQSKTVNCSWYVTRVRRKIIWFLQLVGKVIVKYSTAQNYSKHFLINQFKLT